MKKYYVEGKSNKIFHRPKETKHDDGTSSFSMGFLVCIVADGINPISVVALLNKADPEK